jgi:hypothetical protein
MSGEKDYIRFDARTGRQNQIPCQKRKITPDSLSGEEENITFDVRRAR